MYNRDLFYSILIKVKIWNLYALLWFSEHKAYRQISVHQQMLVSQQGLVLFYNS
jgi:hypothetical protein